MKTLDTALRMLSCFSCVCLFATLWTAACQAPLSMGFSRQEYWRWLPCPPPGDHPDPGIEPASPALQADSLPVSHQGSLASVSKGIISSDMPNKAAREQFYRKPCHVPCGKNKSAYLLRLAGTRHPSKHHIPTHESPLSSPVKLGLLPILPQAEV